MKIKIIPINSTPIELGAWLSASPPLHGDATDKAIEEDAEKLFQVMFTMIPGGVGDGAIIKYLMKHPNKKSMFKKVMLALHHKEPYELEF